MLSLRRYELRMVSDERILRSGEFIEEVRSQAEKRLEETFRLKTRKVELWTLASRVSRSEGTDWDLVRSGSRTAKVVKTRRLFCQLAVKKWGYSGAEGEARGKGTLFTEFSIMMSDEERKPNQRPAPLRLNHGG